MLMNDMFQGFKCRKSSNVVLGIFAVLLISVIVAASFTECCGVVQPRPVFSLQNTSTQNTSNQLQTIYNGVDLQQLGPQPVVSQRELVVPDDYKTINAAISNASSGDTIYVKAGVYYENPVITKSISIIGENSANTVLIGSGGSLGDNVFTVEANNVVISGFTIKSLSYSNASFYANGICLGAGNLTSVMVGEETVPSNSIGGDNCSIVGDNIVNDGWGVVYSGGGKSNLTLSENNITGNAVGGIALFGGSSNVISDNRIYNNTAGAGMVLNGYLDQIYGNYLSGNLRGIELGASNSVVYGNNITQNSVDGIYVETSNNIISANSVSNNLVGIYLNSAFAPENNTIYHNNFVGNSQNAFVGNPYGEEFFSRQTWDNGYPSGGNYWSNYTGVDVKSGSGQNQAGLDGIGDSPLVIDAYNVDPYPLMAPFNVAGALTPPAPVQPLPISSNHLCALWQMNQIGQDDTTPDSTGNNPAVLGSDVHNVTGFAPVLVPGKFGEAMNFTDNQYLIVPVSPSLDVSGAVTIDAWIKVVTIANYAYNNIIVKCTRIDTSKLPPRILGLAVNGLAPGNGNSVPVGALRGYVTTATGGFNEIATTSSVIPLNQWVHVVFTRSLTTGMHLYVNGVEQKVMVTYGVQNPAGPIILGTEYYIGHGLSSAIDELSISNVALVPSVAPLWLQWWFWIVMASVIVIAVGGAVYVVSSKKRRLAISESHY